MKICSVANPFVINMKTKKKENAHTSEFDSCALRHTLFPYSRNMKKCALFCSHNVTVDLRLSGLFLFIFLYRLKLTHTHTPSTHINVSGMKSNVEYLDIFKAFYVEYISVLMCLMQMCQRSLFLKCTLKIEHLFVLLILWSIQHLHFQPVGCICNQADN